MKSISLLITLFFISLISIAQKADSYVEVAGKAVYPLVVNKYQAEFEINAGSVFSADGKDGLKELKHRFFQKAKESGIPSSRFRTAESNLYDSKANSDDRMKLVIETDSKEEFFRILALKEAGGWVYKTSQKITYESFRDSSRVVAQALENARQHATVVAAAMGKKTGKVLAITDYNFFEEFSKSSYAPLKERAYRVRVRFEVE